MATFTITIDNAILQRALDAFATRYNYQAKLEDGGDNPETKAAFAKRMVRQYVQDVIKNTESPQAIQEAVAAKNAEIDALDINVA
jgi:hypothetical protein